VGSLDAVSPIAIGGVGGSGTRLIAQILRNAGFYFGNDRNEAEDNLWFTLLFKRPDVLSESDDEFSALVRLFVQGMIGEGIFSPEQQLLVRSLARSGRAQHPAAWLSARAESLLTTRGYTQAAHWGWKEPNTHVVLDRLVRALPNLRYIHVVRNGLDMAYSRNQNQLKLWGDHFLEPGWQLTPYYSLRFWRVVHERVLRIGQQMGQRFLLLHYDAFCGKPAESTGRLLEFAGIELSPAHLAALAELVRLPGSVGRYKNHDSRIFDPEDVAFVRQLGFDTE
jgi:hypothetical protein